MNEWMDIPEDIYKGVQNHEHSISIEYDREIYHNPQRFGTVQMWTIPNKILVQFSVFEMGSFGFRYGETKSDVID